MKPFSAMNNSELGLAVDEKKALPDMILKRHIFDAQREMVRAHSDLMYNSLRNGGRVSEVDEYKLKSAVLNLFGMIGEMAFENGYFNLNGKTMFKKTDYQYMQDLLYLKPLDNDHDKAVKKLIRLAQYNLNLLHRLNLTNLLIDNSTDDPGIETY